VSVAGIWPHVIMLNISKYGRSAIVMISVYVYTVGYFYMRYAVVFFL